MKKNEGRQADRIMANAGDSVARSGHRANARHCCLPARRLPSRHAVPTLRLLIFSSRRAYTLALYCRVTRTLTRKSAAIFGVRNSALNVCGGQRGGDVNHIK